MHASVGLILELQPHGVDISVAYSSMDSFSPSRTWMPNWNVCPGRTVIWTVGSGSSGSELRSISGYWSMGSFPPTKVRSGTANSSLPKKLPSHCLGKVFGVIIEVAPPLTLSTIWIDTMPHSIRSLSRLNVIQRRCDDECVLNFTSLHSATLFAPTFIVMWFFGHFVQVVLGNLSLDWYSPYGHCTHRAWKKKKVKPHYIKWRREEERKKEEPIKRRK